jgi:hypothetical protein
MTVIRMTLSKITFIRMIMIRLTFSTIAIIKITTDSKVLITELKTIVERHSGNAIILFILYVNVLAPTNI